MSGLPTYQELRNFPFGFCANIAASTRLAVGLIGNRYIFGR